MLPCVLFPSTGAQERHMEFGAEVASASRTWLPASSIRCSDGSVPVNADISSYSGNHRSQVLTAQPPAPSLLFLLWAGQGQELLQPVPIATEGSQWVWGEVKHAERWPVGEKEAEKLPSEKNLQNIFWPPGLQERVKCKACRAAWHTGGILHRNSCWFRSQPDPKRVASLPREASAWPSWQNDTDAEVQNVTPQGACLVGSGARPRA